MHPCTDVVSFSKKMESTGGRHPSPKSPDANPIENLWHELKVYILYMNVTN